jgi:hypothetical protein
VKLPGRYPRGHYVAHCCNWSTCDAKVLLRRKVAGDYGKGVHPDFLTATGRPGHFGLSRMRQHAGETDGKLSIWSAPGSGTELQFSISRAIAYATGESRRRSWLRKRFSAIRERQRS